LVMRTRVARLSLPVRAGREMQITSSASPLSH
jgi:hypothetical protein